MLETTQSPLAGRSSSKGRRLGSVTAAGQLTSKCRVMMPLLSQ
jgi:hypothetical protein